MADLKKFTLEELSLMFDAKTTLTWDRFYYYFNCLYGYSEKECKSMFEILRKFPRKLLAVDGRHPEHPEHNFLAQVMEQVLYVHRLIQNASYIPYDNQYVSERKRESRKIYYKDSEEDVEIKTIIVNFTDASSIIAYAELLKRSVLIWHNSAFSCTINKNPGIEKNADIDVFEGDIFTTNDNYWSTNRSRVFIAQQNGGFKSLIYIKGKGYLKNNQPHYDSDASEFNHHVLTMAEDFIYLGNIATDLHLLKDN